MAWVAAIPAAISAAGSIASMFGNKNKGSQASGPYGFIGGTNPASGVLSELFGYGVQSSKKGKLGYQPFGDWMVPGLQSGLFGTNFKQNVSDYINNPQYAGPSVADIGGILSSVPGLLGDTQGLFNQSILPAAQQLVNTGFRTDIAPVRDYALRQYMRQDLPAIAELFSGQTGTMSSDFLNSAAQAATDMEAQLGALQAQYDESANARRAQGIPLLSQLATTNLGLPTATASDLISAGQGLTGLEQALSPGYRGLSVFQTLAGLGAPSNMGPVASGFQPSQTSSLLAGLGQAAPGFATALGKLPWGQWGSSIKNLFSGNSSPFGGGSTGYGNYAGADYGVSTSPNLYTA